MLLELHSISKTYGERCILKNISLAVNPGETIAIIGPSGSGKTTLLNIAGTLDQPDSGKVIFENRDLSQLSNDERSLFRNQQLGFVFQMHYLLPQCTVLENILLPTLAIDNRHEKKIKFTRAKDMLERIGLSGQMHQFPTQLSGGECQRVAFVRALTNNPRIILADEPTGSLDQETASVLGQLLIDLNLEFNTALIVVTHSLELASKMGKVYSLKNSIITQ